jgi:amino-acid N-acetyltransferase
VLAQPLGVVDGVDYQLTGRVRRVDSEGINDLLDSGNLVLISALGYSLTGEAFNLAIADVAVSVARELGADKLIVFDAGAGIHDPDGTLIRQCTAEEQVTLCPPTPARSALLQLAARACRAGVARCHIVSYRDPDASWPSSSPPTAAVRW